MSLNGLDRPEVQSAYQAAVTEAGGWFLLKYTSRDAVDLLGKGKNGVGEARTAITGYTEASPLYGLIIYRRRRILIKYVPEGTSRLLLARTTVHLQDVLERYTPYETLLEISSSDALNDTSLAASFHLHTASPSPSPSSSRLDEIREDGEDNSPALGEMSSVGISLGAMTGAQRYKADRRMEHLKRRAERAERSVSPLQRTDSEPSLLVGPAPALPAKTHSAVSSQFLVREESGQTSITKLEPIYPIVGDEPSNENHAHVPINESELASQTTDDTASDLTDATEVPVFSETASTATASTATASNQRGRDLPKLHIEREIQSNSTADSSSSSGPMGEPTAKAWPDDDPYDLAKYDEFFKPKVKLGPRPVAPPEATKARTSALPASFKPNARKHEQTAQTPSLSRPSTAATTASASTLAMSTTLTTATEGSVPASFTFTYAPPPVPDVPEYSPRPNSRGSVKSTPSHKSTGMMTPDKLRLMKAIEHRKRQLRKSREQQTTVPAQDDVPQVPDLPPKKPAREPRFDPDYDHEHTTDDEGQPQSTKADSGIELIGHQEAGGGSNRSGPILENLSASRGMTVELAAKTNDLAKMVQESALDTQYRSSLADNKSNNPPVERPQSATENIEQGQTVLVPTIVMADGSRPITCDEQDHSEVDAASKGDPSGNRLNSKRSVSDLSEAASFSHQRKQSSDVARRRQGFVEPLQTDLNSGNPDDFASDDDEFFEELNSATVQEAKPVMVSTRSPLTATFSGGPGRRPSADTLTSVKSVNITRAATVPLDKPMATSGHTSPELPKSSESSRAATPLLAERNDAISGLSRNVSSGISKRIQALAEMSNWDASHSASNGRPLTPEYSPNTLAPQERERKSAAPRPRPTSFKRLSGNRGAQSPSVSPAAENAPVWSVQHDPATNRSSVSVTARIVRPNAIEESEQDEDPIRQSEITVNQKRESANFELSPLDTSFIPSGTSSPALSPVASRFSAEVRTLHSASRFGRHKQPSSPINDDVQSPPPNRAMSQASGASTEDSAASREGGRTSRFFKRISNFGGPGRRKSTTQSAGSTTVTSIAEDASAPIKAIYRASAVPDTPPAIVVGDLNVQFPDSLLWKRRIVTIDEVGNLQFAIAHAMEIHKGVAVKRYPLHDFGMPYAPDLDSQELPHSVVLELRDGTALQAACEDAMTQRQVLHLLKTYWRAWAVSSS